MSDFDNSDQQDDTSALNESIDMLSNAWRTELNAPEILPYKDDLVEEIQLLLNNQEVSSDFDYYCVGTIRIYSFMENFDS
jgi:hypothetical protein